MRTASTYQSGGGNQTPGLSVRVVITRGLLAVLAELTFRSGHFFETSLTQAGGAQAIGVLREQAGLRFSRQRQRIAPATAGIAGKSLTAGGASFVADDATLRIVHDGRSGWKPTVRG